MWKQDQRSTGRLQDAATRLVLPGLLALVLAGCGSPDDSDGIIINQILLPTDTLVNLACIDVGIRAESCVLGDPENPFATALTRRPSGENQWLTARALHELHDANSDPLIRDQALRAYRSVTFFECCGGGSFPATLNERVADGLFRTGATGFVRLVPRDPINVLVLFREWGYTYRPATPPDFVDGLVFIARF